MGLKMSLVWDMFHFRYLEHLSRNVRETAGYVALRCSTWTEERGLGVSTTCMVTKALGMHDRTWKEKRNNPQQCLREHQH